MKPTTFKKHPLYKDYIVSDMGDVFSIKQKRVCTPRANIRGYVKLDISLGKKGVRKSLFIHRMVAETFLSNEENKPNINHINGIKNDNRLENLEWCTQKENVAHAVNTGLMKMSHLKGEKNHKSKLNKNDVEEIRLNYMTMPVKEVSKIFGVSASTISRIRLMRGWKS